MSDKNGNEIFAANGKHLVYKEVTRYNVDTHEYPLSLS